MFYVNQHKINIISPKDMTPVDGGGVCTIPGGITTLSFGTELCFQ